MLGWSSIQTGRTWISWRIIASLLTQCIETLVLGTNWKTRHSVVGQQICKSRRKMYSCLRQTFSKIDFMHSSHKWLPRILSWGQHCSALSTGFYSKTLTLLAILKTQNQLREMSLMYIRKPNICPHQLDVQEADISIPQFYRIRKHSSWMLDCAWMDCLLLILWDIVIEVLRSTNNTPRHDKLAQGNLVQDRQSQTSIEMRKRECEQLSMWVMCP